MSQYKVVGFESAGPVFWFTVLADNFTEALKLISTDEYMKDMNFCKLEVHEMNTEELIEQSKQPVVPQYVADFYESIKDNFETKLYNYFIEFYNGWEDNNSDFDYWFNSTAEPIQTLVKMKLFGYVVKEEKLYTVELPQKDSNKNHHVVLRKLWNGKVVVNNSYVDWWRDYESTQLTESEIKKDFSDAWKYAKEVL